MTPLRRFQRAMKIPSRPHSDRECLPVVVLLNGYSRHNMGDWLLFEESAHLIRERHPGCRIVGLALDPTSFHGWTSVDEVCAAPITPGHMITGLVGATLGLITAGRLGPRSFMAIRKASAVYSVGGGFIQFRSLRELVSVGLVHGLQWLMARRAGQSIHMFPQSIGPFVGRPQRQFARILLNNIDPLIVRDSASQAHISALSTTFPSRVQIVPDLVFNKSRRLAQNQDVTLPVGVVVRNWWFPGNLDPREAQQRYLEEIATTIAALENSGRQVDLIVHCDGPAARGDDRIATNRVQALLPQPVKVVNLFETPTLQAATQQYARYGLIISVRLHAALLAIQQGAPAIAIAYETKSTEIFGQLGIEDWVQPIDNLSADRLISLANSPFPHQSVTMRWDYLKNTLHDHLQQ